MCIRDSVYTEIESWAAHTLAAGHAAILDAVQSKPADRDAARAIAQAAGVRFDGIWLEAKPESLIKRVSGRTGDASDATAEVVRKQLAYETGPIDWTVVDTGGGANDAISRTCRTIDIESPISSDRS